MYTRREYFRVKNYGTIADKSFPRKQHNKRNLNSLNKRRKRGLRITQVGFEREDRGQNSKNKGEEGPWRGQTG